MKALEDRLALACTRLAAESAWAKAEGNRDMAFAHEFTIDQLFEGDDAWRANQRRHPVYKKFRNRIRTWLERGAEKLRESQK